MEQAATHERSQDPENAARSRKSGSSRYSSYRRLTAGCDHFFFELSPGASVISARRAPLIPTHELDVIG